MGTTVVKCYYDFTLDKYPVAGAYSLRKLRAGANQVVRLRRSSDNAESDFTASDISNGNILSWAGGGNAFVRTWYDQSGNGRHLEQSQNTRQPQLISSGAFLTENGSPYLLFDGSDDYLFFTGSTGVSSDLSVFCVGRKVTHSNNTGYFSFIPSGVSPNNRDWASSDGRSVGQGISGTTLRFTAHDIFEGSNGFGTFAGALDVESTELPISNHFLVTTFQSGGVGKIRINNNVPQESGYGGTPTSPNGLVVGSRYNITFELFGRNNYKELIYFGSDLSANSSELTSNLNTYYNLY
jgi:hypothetical protein